jgi:hypothetical protein
MSRLKQLPSTALGIAHSGPTLIIAGLAGLILVAAIPTIPAVTALSTLTLGATNALLDRFRNSQTIAGALLVHAAVYGSLYALFIGATLQGAATSPGGALGTPYAVDLAASLVPTAVALRRIAVALRRQSEPQR